MDANVVFDMVNDFDKNSVVFSGVESGTGELPVDGDDWLACT